LPLVGSAMLRDRLSVYQVSTDTIQMDFGSGTTSGNTIMLTFQSEIDPHDMDVKIDSPPFVALREPGPWRDQPVLDLLQALAKYVRENVFAALQPLLN
ncbi:MAG TPA: hypothetical protein VGC47_15130, partial [Acidimicrobiia bacterium]